MGRSLVFIKSWPLIEVSTDLNAGVKSTFLRDNAMIKRIVTVLVFGVLFLGLIIPQDSLEALKPNLSAAQAKPAAKSQASSSALAKKKAVPVTEKHRIAKNAAMKKIREAQRILDNNFGPGAVRVNRALNQMNREISLIKQVRN